MAVRVGIPQLAGFHRQPSHTSIQVATPQLLPLRNNRHHLLNLLLSNHELGRLPCQAPPAWHSIRPDVLLHERWQRSLPYALILPRRPH